MPTRVCRWPFRRPRRGTNAESHSSGFESAPFSAAFSGRSVITRFAVFTQTVGRNDKTPGNPLRTFAIRPYRSYVTTARMSSLSPLRGDRSGLGTTMSVRPARIPSLPSTLRLGISRGEAPNPPCWYTYSEFVSLSSRTVLSRGGIRIPAANSATGLLRATRGLVLRRTP